MHGEGSTKGELGRFPCEGLAELRKMEPDLCHGYQCAHLRSLRVTARHSSRKRIGCPLHVPVSRVPRHRPDPTWMEDEAKLSARMSCPQPMPLPESDHQFAETARK